jgi:hypothetical protein
MSILDALKKATGSTTGAAANGATTVQATSRPGPTTTAPAQN